jgi:riboflavin synthase
MFSGIVETQSRVLKALQDRDLLRIEVERPQDFDDIRIGDSIATSGVCLTVETFSEKNMTFALGAETLKVTGWTKEVLLSHPVNLERSLRFGDRIHGHMVSGHVDTVGEVTLIEDVGGSVQFNVRAPKEIQGYVWKKGSWAVNGVSLTINSVEGDIVGMCLIPETLKRTNLGELKKGDRVNLEVDMVARGLIQYLKTSGLNSDELARRQT